MTSSRSSRASSTSRPGCQTSDAFRYRPGALNAHSKRDSASATTLSRSRSSSTRRIAARVRAETRWTRWTTTCLRGRHRSARTAFGRLRGIALSDQNHARIVPRSPTQVSKMLACRSRRLTVTSRAPRCSGRRPGAIARPPWTWRTGACPRPRPRTVDLRSSRSGGHVWQFTGRCRSGRQWRPPEAGFLENSGAWVLGQWHDPDQGGVELCARSLRLLPR
jgi:hypothetical protein